MDSKLKQQQLGIQHLANFRPGRSSGLSSFQRTNTARHGRHLSDPVQLRYVIFSGPAQLGCVIFSGLVQFGCVIFSSTAKLGCVIFSGPAQLGRVIFSGPAQLGCVTFSRQTDVDWDT